MSNFNTMHELLSEHISRRSRENEFRDSYWRSMSDNNWTSREMETLTERAVIFFDMKTRDMRGRPTRDEIIDIINQIVDMDLADFVIGVPRLRDILENECEPEIRRNVQDSKREYEMVIRDIARYMDEIERRGRDSDRDRRNSNDRYGGRDDREVRRDRFGGSSRNNDRETRDRSAASSSATGLASVLTRSAQTSSQEQRREEPAPEQRTHREESRREANALKVQSVEIPPDTGLNGPDMTKAKPHYEYWLDGEFWQLSRFSKLRLTVDSPFISAIDPSSELSYYVFNPKDQSVREEIIQMSNKSAYLALELRNPIELERYESARRVGPIERRSSEEEGSQPPVVENLSDTELVMRNYSAIQNLRMPDKSLTYSSLDEGDTAALIRLKTSGNMISLHRHAVITPIATQLSGSELLIDIASSATLTDAHGRLMRAKNTASIELWDMINSRLTEAVNFSILYRFGKNGRIANFALNYPDLLETLKILDPARPNLPQVFSEAVRQYAEDTTLYLDGEVAEEYFCDLLDISKEEYQANRPAALGLIDSYSIVAVGFTYAELALQIPTERSVSINKSRYPNLHNFCFAIAQASDSNRDDGGTNRLYILTTDHVRLELTRSGYDSNILLIRRM